MKTEYSIFVEVSKFLACLVTRNKCTIKNGPDDKNRQVKLSAKDRND